MGFFIFTEDGRLVGSWEVVQIGGRRTDSCLDAISLRACGRRILTLYLTLAEQHRVSRQRKLQMIKGVWK